MEESMLYPQTAADLVYQHLRRQIFSKKRLPGERLPEVLIARELNVSRTPVREALRRLTNEGLVDLIPNVGARLAAPSKQEILDTYEVREYLECLAARKAAVNISPQQIAGLQELIDRENEIFAEKDLERYLQINNDFHHLLAKSSRNRVLTGYVDNVLARTYVYMVFYEKFFESPTNPSLDEHRSLLATLKAHDQDQAESTMRRHLQYSESALKEPTIVDDNRNDSWSETTGQ